MIKVPATAEGIAAITQLVANGINVNATLLFGLERYRQVLDAYMMGLELRLENGDSLEQVASVASFFLSRIDVFVDRRLDELAHNGAAETAHSLRGEAAIASARLAYQHFKRAMQSPRWRSLRKHGAQVQRLLWASTSTKDPAYSDTKYIEALIGQETVNTMPPKTLAAYRQHGHPALRIEQELAKASALPGQLAELGIDLELVGQQLEDEGVQKFIAPYDKVLALLEQQKSEFGISHHL
jgi:transaldolase/transaldolase/glucose-6-phosphate isomerase